MKKSILLNPITDELKSIVHDARLRLYMAVPFISSFAMMVLNRKALGRIKDKRLLTRVDDCNLNTFELSVFQHLLENGFKIRYNKKIHLKLYLNETCALVTSSNLTAGGLELNTELTVKIVQKEQHKECVEIIEDMWRYCPDEITLDFIRDNWSKYLLLKKRKHLEEQTKPVMPAEFTSPGTLDPLTLLDKIIFKNHDYSRWRDFAYKANKRREAVIDQLMRKFSTRIFYAPPGHAKRYENLFYDFTYGYENRLAGTGLRESQFRTIFEHSHFKQVIEFIVPQIVGLKPWNLSDNNSFQQFCNGLFDFKIPQYSETMPIRLASYFYPEVFFPVFKLKHLKKMCEYLGLNSSPKSVGDQLYLYNNYLRTILRNIPEDNYVKSHIAYQHLYTYETYLALSAGKNLKEFKLNYSKTWQRELIDGGVGLLKEMGVVRKMKS